MAVSEVSSSTFCIAGMGRTADSMHAVALGCLGEDPAQVRGKALQARSGILDVRHAEEAGGFGLFKRLLVGVEPRRFFSSQMSPTTGQSLSSRQQSALR